MAAIQAERTPNPNSLKFSTDDGQAFHDNVVALSSAEEADRHALGKQLFAIEGVDDVFITPEFVTVSKTPSTEWSEVQPKVEAALSEYLET